MPPHCLGKWPAASSKFATARAIWRRLLWQEVLRPDSRADWIAGIKIPIKVLIMAMTARKFNQRKRPRATSALSRLSLAAGWRGAGAEGMNLPCPFGRGAGGEGNWSLSRTFSVKAIGTTP